MFINIEKAKGGFILSYPKLDADTTTFTLETIREVVPTDSKLIRRLKEILDQINPEDVSE